MNSCNDWILLTGGSVNSVFKKGNVIRRKLTAASPAIHQLLEYLAAQNLTCVPRLIDRDKNYEYLSYFPGESITRPWCEAVKTDEFIAQLGEWLKDYHNAIADFELEGDAKFNWGVSQPQQDMIVCHGDLGPWNCIQQNGNFQGIIDWDLAKYGYVVDNIAEFIFEFIPFRPNLQKTMGEKVSDKVLFKRLETFCKAYQYIEPDEIIKHIPIYLTLMNKELSNYFWGDRISTNASLAKLDTANLEAQRQGLIAQKEQAAVLAQLKNCARTDTNGTHRIIPGQIVAKK